MLCTLWLCGVLLLNSNNILKYLFVLYDYVVYSSLTTTTTTSYIYWLSMNMWCTEYSMTMWCTPPQQQQQHLQIFICTLWLCGVLLLLNNNNNFIYWFVLYDYVVYSSSSTTTTISYIDLYSMTMWCTPP